MHQSFLRISGWGLIICAALSIQQALGLEVSGQVQIEVKFAQVDRTAGEQALKDLPLQRPIDFLSTLRPIGTVPSADANRLVDRFRSSGEATVRTLPQVTTQPDQPARISTHGIQLDVNPIINPNGSIGLNMTPSIGEVTVQRGSTALYGRTISNGKYNQILFLTPRIIVPSAGRVGEPPTVPLETGVGTTPFIWNGPYIGLQTGYTRTGSDYDLKLSGMWMDLPELAEGIRMRARREFDEDAAQLGGLMGYNFQCGRWVYGGEIGGRRYWGTGDSFDTKDFDVDQQGPFDVMSRFRTSYLFTAGPRVGYSVGRFLPYVSGGLAFGEVDASQKLFVDGDFRQTGRVSEVQTGWMAAGGLQYAFTDKLSIRVEYQYSDLGTANYAVKPSEPDLRFQGWGSTSLTEHSANFSVIYNFGPRGNAPGLSLPALPPPPP